MSSMHERRFTEGRVELRLRGGDDESRTIGGYAAKFGKRSEDLGGFYEVIDAKAFNQARGRGFAGVVALYNHDQNMLLGTTHARTLRVDVDEVGLVYEVDLPAARADVHELVQRGDVAKSSFAFRAVGPDGDHWEMDENNVVRRTLLNVQLFDVSPVNTPAYDDTSVAVRSLDGALVSLANQMGADPEEVRAAMREHELRRFFRRSDVVEKPATLAGHAALMSALERGR